MNRPTSCPEPAALRALLNDAPGADVATLERHIETCASCQTALDQLTDASDLIAPVDDSSDVPAAVVRQLHETPWRAESTAEIQKPAIQRPSASVRVEGFSQIEHVASGATGALYRATDDQLQRIVALKVLHAHVADSDAARARVHREARALAAIHHPHVVTVYASGEADDQRPYIAMEYVAGETLSQLMESHGPISATRAAKLIEQTARGLAATHQAGLIHRDIKSSNLLVTSDGTAEQMRIIDFGLVQEDEQNTRLTQDGMLAGTPAYMSPEQITSPRAVDARSDIYSLGIVLYELLTGSVPYRGTVRMALQQVLHAAPQSLRELNDAVPADLQTICLKAIEKEPSRRYASATEMADDLQRWLHHKPIIARPVSTVEKTWRWCRRNPRITILLALVAFALTSTAVVSAASAYRVAVAGNEVREADEVARRHADALVAQRDAAMETVRRLVFDVTPLLQQPDTPLSEVEATILQIALEGLDRVGQTAEDSGEVDYNTAHALQQLGDALYQADELDSAETQLQRGLRLVQQMEQRGEDIDVTSELKISLHTSLAGIDWDRRQSHQERAHYKQALEVARQWYTRQPDSHSACFSLAMVGNMLAESWLTTDEPDLAVPLFEQSRHLLQDLPDDPAVLVEREAATVGLESHNDLDPSIRQCQRRLQNELRTAQRQYDQPGRGDTSKISGDDATVEPAELADVTAARTALFEAQLNMADWHIVFGDSQRAITLLTSTAAFISETPLETRLHHLMIDRRKAEAYFTGDFTMKKARREYEKSLQADAQRGSDSDSATDSRTIDRLLQEQARCHLAICEIHTLQGEHDRAAPSLQKAQALLQQVSQPPLIVRERLKATLESAWIAWGQDRDAAATAQLQTARLLWNSDAVQDLARTDDPFAQAWREQILADFEELTTSLTAKTRP
ncbi:MAG: serine/threonine protein kinase [Planctomycetaceae bacterium]|nr:serine/threonine protein kinase [Planctomycetaceae bacterium]